MDRDEQLAKHSPQVRCLSLEGLRPGGVVVGHDHLHGRAPFGTDQRREMPSDCRTFLPRSPRGIDGAGGCARGIGIDDPICLSVIDETEARIDGVGRAYKLRRTGPGAIAVQVSEPGQSFSLVD